MQKLRPEIGKLYWFVHSVNNVPLGFIRQRNNGAFIIGGKTGSHCTGHLESYWDKLKEVISLSYIPVDIGKELRLVQESWKPPAITPDDQEFIDRIQKGEL